eukprot:scaffold266498_cov30-Tisochrysis_lutea.AAC.4
MARPNSFLHRGCRLAVPTMRWCSTRKRFALLNRSKKSSHTALRAQRSIRRSFGTSRGRYGDASTAWGCNRTDGGTKRGLEVVARDLLSFPQSRAWHCAACQYAQLQPTCPTPNLCSQKALCYLAKRSIELDRTSPHSCCVIGNCFSLQKEHDVAIKFFSRAIQLRPDFAYAHTLCGHEHTAKDDWEKVIFHTARVAH